MELKKRCAQRCGRGWTGLWAGGRLKEVGVWDTRDSVAQDQGLQEVETLQRRPGAGACTRLKQALEELVAGSR